MALRAPPIVRHLGRERSHPREVYLLSIERLSDLPSRLKVPCQRFVMLLTADTTGADLDKTVLADSILGAGCVYFCAWGPGCEAMHDVVDDVFLERIDYAPDKGVLMTTWHDSEPLADAVEFALLSAWPDDYYLDGCGAVVLAVSGNDAWASEIEATAMRVIEPNVI